MSLTSYRAAPPRVYLVHLGPGFPRGAVRPTARVPLAGSRGSYQPDAVILLLHPALGVYLGCGFASQGWRFWEGLQGLAATYSSTP